MYKRFKFQQLLYQNDNHMYFTVVVGRLFKFSVQTLSNVWKLLTRLCPEVVMCVTTMTMQGVVLVERSLGGQLVDKPKSILFQYVTMSALCLTISELCDNWRCKIAADTQVSQTSQFCFEYVTWQPFSFDYWFVSILCKHIHGTLSNANVVLALFQLYKLELCNIVKFSLMLWWNNVHVRSRP